jgi:hypothetical protein
MNGCAEKRKKVELKMLRIFNMAFSYLLDLQEWRGMHSPAERLG